MECLWDNSNVPLSTRHENRRVPTLSVKAKTWVKTLFCSPCSPCTTHVIANEENAL